MSSFLLFMCAVIVINFMVMLHSGLRCSLRKQFRILHLLGIIFGISLLLAGFQLWNSDAQVIAVVLWIILCVPVGIFVFTVNFFKVRVR